jgi:hypothetical protein
MSDFEWEEPDWLKPFGLSVWHEFSGLARKVGAVNLGQGFPGWAPEVRDGQPLLTSQPLIIEAAKKVRLVQVFFNHLRRY